MADVQNIILGDCAVTYNSVALGHTKGGVTVRVATEKRQVTVDKFGATPVRTFNNGQTVEVTVPLVEVTLDQIKLAIPNSTKVTGSTKDEINVGGDAGREITGAVLLLTPDADADLAITIHNAIQTGDFEMKMSNDEESILELTFMGMIKETEADGERLMRIGTSD